MSPSYAILPCNGLDKPAGHLSTVAAKAILATGEHHLVCPVLCHTAPKRYAKDFEGGELLVIDGCNTRCASKLAAEQGLKISKRLNISADAVALNLAAALAEDAPEAMCKALIDALIAKVSSDEDAAKERTPNNAYPESVSFTSFTKGKFIFKVPEADYHFNENDCWVLRVGDHARIGVSDFIQQNLSDILFVDLPSVGATIEQFGELGSIESGKSIFELVSPVSGVVTAVNTALDESPERVNDYPYTQGWIAEVQLTDWDEDSDLLLDSQDYFEIMKKKVEELNV